MRSILQLCLLLLLLGAGGHAWGKVTASPPATAWRAVEDSAFRLGDGAPPARPASGEAAMWGLEVAGAGNGRPDSTPTTAGLVVVPGRGAAFMACPGAPPSSGPGATTNLAWMQVGPNVYAYVKENPWTGFDPDGLKTKGDYRDDMRAAGKKRDAAMKAAGKNASEKMRFGIENRYKNEMWAAQQGINGIEQTARKMEHYNRSTGLHFTASDEEMLDDNDSLYKSFNRTVGLVTMVPGSGTADHAMHGEYGQAALSFGLDVGLTLVGGRLVKMPAANGGLRVASSAGGETLPMSMVRPIQQGETIANLMNEVKGLTWQTGNEYAVVTLANGQRAIVSGGSGGIKFADGQIKNIFGHTHPTAAPPSAADATALQQLGQSQQTVLHGGMVTKVRPNH